jgi:hypothetical protein
MTFEALRLRPLASLALFAGLIFAGCSSPPPKGTTLRFGPPESLKNYRKVHILPPTTDPRMVQVKLLTRLRALGFEANAVGREQGLGRPQGTAFLVSQEGHLLTCAHVLGQEEKATVWLAGSKHEAQVVRRDAEKDVALLKIIGATNLMLAPVGFSASADPLLGQDVFTIGFPLSDILGQTPRLTKGLISATVGLKDDPNHLQVSVEIQPGNSGGPLLNEKGECVGIVRSTLNPMRVLTRSGGSLPQNVNFALKSGVIRDFLDRAGVQPIIATNLPDRANFDTVKDSVALLRGGVRTPEEEEQPEMICRVLYSSVSARELRFRFFTLSFYDEKSGKLLFRTGLQADDKDNSEDKVMERAIEDIRRAFFPVSATSKSKY